MSHDVCRVYGFGKIVGCSCLKVAWNIYIVYRRMILHDIAAFGRNWRRGKNWKHSCCRNAGVVALIPGGGIVCKLYVFNKIRPGRLVRHNKMACQYVNSLVTGGEMGSFKE